MTRPKLYYAQVSPAARSTLLTVAALGLDVERIPVNLMAGEHLTPQFLKVYYWLIWVYVTYKNLQKCNIRDSDYLKKITTVKYLRH